MCMDHLFFSLTTVIVRLVSFRNLVGFECVEDVGDLLMMIMFFVKTTVFWEFHHLRLIFAYTVAACVVDV